MARGDSGRIVIEMEPEAKRQLYAALALTGSTLKDWFIKRAAEFCAEATQPSLFSSPHSAHPNANNTTEGIPHQSDTDHNKPKPAERSRRQNSTSNLT
jgi:hypothetical protein